MTGRPRTYGYHDIDPSQLVESAIITTPEQDEAEKGKHE